jgi:hypothetical protein
MVTIGDVFSIVATLAGLALTLWSFLIACALLFPAKVNEAHRAVSIKPAGSFGMGIVSLVLGVFAFTILSLPNPGLKLFGTVGLAGYLGLVAIGGAGIAQLCSERIMSQSNETMSRFRAFGQASAYLVIAGMLPVLGWFLFAPLFMVIAGGAGLKAVLKQNSRETVGSNLA